MGKRVLACALALVGGVVCGGRLSSQARVEQVSSEAYWRVVAQYRAGLERDAIAAANGWALATFDEARRSLASATPADLAAAVVLHAATALRSAELLPPDLHAHVEMARRALAAADDEELPPRLRARWYLVTIGLLEGQARFGAAAALSDEAVLRLPMDAELLLAAGTLDEFLATPHSGVIGDAASRADGTSLPAALSPEALRTRRKQGLERAEAFYRMALCRDPSLLEARLRLGRVLHLRRRYDEALQELRLVDGATDPRLRYLAALFSADVQRSARRAPLALAAYAEAERRCAGCLTPAIGASALHREEGDGDRAFDILQRGLTRDRITPLHDPWWDYPLGTWPKVPQLLRQLRESLR